MNDAECNWEMTRTGHDSILEFYYRENGWEIPGPEDMVRWWQVYQIWLKDLGIPGVCIDEFLSMLRESSFHKAMQGQ